MTLAQDEPSKLPRPYVVAVCWDSAATVAMNMTKEGQVATIEGHNVRIGPLADSDVAKRLADRLTRSSLKSHVEWAKPPGEAPSGARHDPDPTRPDLPHDPETGEVLEDGAVESGTAKPKKRAPREWYTAPDGTRRQRTVSAKPSAAPDATAATDATADATADANDATATRVSKRTRSPRPRSPADPNRVDRFAAGTWRYDIDSEGNRVRRNLTPDEIAEAAAHKAATEARRAEERALIGTLIPILRVEGDPPAKIEHVIPLDKRTVQGAELVSCVRPNGSRLRLVGRYYDGEWRSGHRPLAYVSAYVVFYSQTGLPFRTRGVMFERGELRNVASALLAEADRLDAAEAAGELPDFLQPIPNDTNGQSSNGHHHPAAMATSESR